MEETKMLTILILAFQVPLFLDPVPGLAHFQSKMQTGVNVWKGAYVGIARLGDESGRPGHSRAFIWDLTGR